MLARGQTQTVTLPITAPEPGQEPGPRVTLQPGRAGWGGMRWGRGGGSAGCRSFWPPFTSCHHHHFGGGGGFEEWVVMQGEGQLIGYVQIVFGGGTLPQIKNITINDKCHT